MLSIHLKEYYEIVGEGRPLSGFFPHTCWFFLQKCISNHEIKQASKFQKFRMIRALIASQSMFEKLKLLKNKPFFPEVKTAPQLRCNSFKLRCNFQVHLWFNILTWFGVQKPRLHFCSNFSRWIAVTYFSSRKLRCDMRKFQDCFYPCYLGSMVFNKILSWSYCIYSYSTTP